MSEHSSPALRDLATSISAAAHVWLAVHDNPSSGASRASATDTLRVIAERIVDVTRTESTEPDHAAVLLAARKVVDAYFACGEEPFDATSLPDAIHKLCDAIGFEHQCDYIEFNPKTGELKFVAPSAEPLGRVPAGETDLPPKEGSG